MSDNDARAVVIGAGIVGVSCALFLQRLGRHVVLIDRLDPGDDGASSFGNAGSLSWSSCVPIAIPGLLPKVPGWLLSRTGPLTIRWRHIPTLAPWLWRYARSGSLASVEAAAEALAMLHAPALDLHRELAREAGVQDLIRSCGYLHIYRRAARDRLSHLEWRLRAEHGARLELLDGAALHEVEPDLAPGYVQAVRVHDQGFTANPSRLVSSLAAHFVARGGQRVRGEVRDLKTGGDAVHSVVTESDSIAAAEVVIAAGAWSTQLTRMLGIDLPLETERGYHVTLGDPGVSVCNTIMETEGKFVATPMEMGLRLAGTVEFASLDAAPDYRRADAILERGRSMFPGLRPATVSRWMGRRPSLPDGLPVIGPAPGYRNVHLAFGHAHTGMIGAPNTARIIAGMVCGQPLNVDATAFRAERFLSRS
ncbi:MAG: FAD-binding oxidoreductase [Deltaproteobacteria bacterium]|nr:FAD-binding oxidoreductase [Deltaproteobacteria bacterium]MBW2398902.1 FAD-binding oxidoreductase [Deltaproteobacteria bacterium]